MERLLSVMSEYNVPTICFSDSIGSYGAAGPRDNATARWLTENPSQDPGSDYGKQKRECRELMKAWAAEKCDDKVRIYIRGYLSRWLLCNWPLLESL